MRRRLTDPLLNCVNNRKLFTNFFDFLRGGDGKSRNCKHVISIFGPSVDFEIVWTVWTYLARDFREDLELGLEPDNFAYFLMIVVT